ncbi:MAG: NUDIX hydrolase [Candidatus Parcubacteria bacterium]|nr:NUDIX hydrolase [Candidatus Parcubacteria bacterium]
MKVVYAGEKFSSSWKKAIFLAGPTPRDKAVPSWRPQAIALLQAKGYDGVVFFPESPDGLVRPDYDDQVVWETDGLNRADVILFWVPRDLQTMPAFTTNVEFGEWFKSGKIIFGFPKDAANIRYLEYKAKSTNTPCTNTLEATVDTVLSMIGNGAAREGGETFVPLHIWQTVAFQNWYQNLKTAGNRLDSARVEWVFRVGPKKNFVFLWVLYVDVFITKENRHKTNEVILARPDIATILMYKPAETLLATEIVLIREFRSPVSNSDGYVWEIPGGSSFKPKEDPNKVAAHEAHEETGLEIPAERFKAIDARQLCATLSAHKAHLFSVELTAEEINWLRQEQGVAHGVIEDTERTYVEIKTLKEILDQNLVDWSMLGMILSVLTK